MSSNNAINAPTSSSGWTSYVTTITGSTTSPTTGTVSYNQSYYLQVGKILYLTYSFAKTSGGTAGSGYYIWSIPAGFTIDTTVVKAFTNATPGTFTALGPAFQENYGISASSGSVAALDGTHLVMFTMLNQNFVGSGGSFYPMTLNPLHYSFSATIPIL